MDKQLIKNLSLGLGTGLGTYLLSGLLPNARNNKIRRLLGSLGIGGGVAYYGTNIRQGLNKLYDKLSGQQKLKPTSRTAAQFALRNLALAMRIESVKRGSGGHRNFTDSLQKIKGYSKSDLHRAFQGGQGNYGGYKFLLKPYPSKDNFKSNFRVYAVPDEGYSGPILSIDKSEKPR